MKEKIYILYDDDIGEVVATSYDKQLLEEMMVDYFIEDWMYENYWETVGPYSTECDYGSACLIVKENYDIMINWYNSYMLILESEVIE